MKSNDTLHKKLPFPNFFIIFCLLHQCVSYWKDFTIWFMYLILFRSTVSAFIKVHFYLPSEEAMYSAEYGNYFPSCYTPNSEEDMDFGSQTSPPKVRSSPQQRKKTLKRPCSSSTDDVVMTKPTAYSGVDSSQPSPDSAQQPTSSTPFLPPCRVCGEKASGFHYGVNTCEACKVRLLYFFVIQIIMYWYLINKNFRGVSRMLCHIT